MTSNKLAQDLADLELRVDNLAAKVIDQNAQLQTLSAIIDVLLDEYNNVEEEEPTE